MTPGRTGPLAIRRRLGSGYLAAAATPEPATGTVTEPELDQARLLLVDCAVPATELETAPGAATRAGGSEGPSLPLVHSREEAVSVRSLAGQARAARRCRVDRLVGGFRGRRGARRSGEEDQLFGFGGGPEAEEVGEWAGDQQVGAAVGDAGVPVPAGGISPSH